MKMLMIVYNHALDDEMMELLDNNDVSGYTKIENVTGDGASEPHLGTNVWPATNNIVYVAVENSKVPQIKADGRELSARFAGEGMRLFVWSLTEML